MKILQQLRQSWIVTWGRLKNVLLLAVRFCVAVGALFALLGWLVAWPAYKEQMAAAEIERVRGKLVNKRVGPNWLSGWVFKFDRPRTVNLETTHITDSGLERVCGLTSLNALILTDTRITDDGAEHLESLPDLDVLGLGKTGITDDGLKHVGCLSSLLGLWLSDTRIGNDGLKHLGGLTRLEVLQLDNTEVNDDGLRHLDGLTSLIHLSLVGTDVTDDGVKRLQEALPDCYVQRQLPE